MVAASGEASIIGDLRQVRIYLLTAARLGHALSYSELLERLGLGFSRPKMRALCVTLGRIDRAGSKRGEPELAVLVVRQSDGLPGQGWWVAGGARDHGYDGPWEGPEARTHIDRLQQRAFAYWAQR